MTDTLKVGIASYEEMKQRTLAIARGELKPSKHEPQVWFTSAESFARVLSNPNRELLSLIAGTHPESIQALSESSGRAVSNLSRTLKTMERYGLVRLDRQRGRVRPEVAYRKVQLEVGLTT